MTDFVSKSLKLNVMGFCGADDSVHPEHLQILSIHYSWIEWGILFRPDKEGEPRYASFEWVKKLCQINKDTGGMMRLAGHLCSSRCQEVLEGDITFIKLLSELGFGRIQINATAANNVNVDNNKIQYYITNLKKCMNEVTDLQFIIQCNEETKPIWSELIKEPPTNMSILFDASCGLGVLATNYPKPLSNIYCGYAGGIGPENVEDVLHKVSTATNGISTWIDMESSIRVKITDKNVKDKDVFSLEKCYACVHIGVNKFALPVSRFTLLSV